MPEAITAPPPAPAAAPTTLPEPLPAPPASKFTDVFDAIDKMGDAPVKPDAAPDKTPKKEPEKPAAAAPEEPAKPADKPADRPADKTPEKPAEPPKGDELPSFRTNAELRKWAQERHRSALTAEGKLKEMDKQMADLKAIEPQSHQAATVLTAKMADLQKRIDAQEQVLEMQSFEHSEKYQKDYAKPYYDALAKAEKEVVELLVTEQTGENDEEGNPKTRQRPATKQDFQKIYSLPRAQAKQLAKQMFGDDADEVMGHRKKVSELAEKALEAVNDRRQNHVKYREQEQAQRTQEQVAVENLWKTANEKISSDPKRAAFWGEDKDDPEANKALAGGFQLADEFFSEKRDAMPMAERVEFDAYVRHVIAMGPRLAYKVKKLTGLYEAAQAEIASLRGSKPGAPVPTGGEPTAAPKGVMAAIDAMGE